MTLLYSLWFNLTFYAANLMCVVLMGLLLFPRKTIVCGVQIWLGTVAWVESHLGGIRYTVIGREYVPKGACIIAAKHQSEWETFKLHLLLDDPAIVLKRELLNIPLIGWWMSRSGSIPIDRGARVKSLSDMTRAARKAADEGRPIVIFPEGTRVAVGESRPYKSGVAALYMDLNLPVVPMALNSGLLWPKNSFFKKPGTITVEFLPPIPPGLPREEMMQKLRDTLEPAAVRLLKVGTKIHAAKEGDQS
ncbi:MAG: lysophospholipid acyltransferase family protein [Alphaproteobacteria bacterium]|nr:lysophospholipid acyltransferase family protein [Alphaproteobacteria bacterium]